MFVASSTDTSTTPDISSNVDAALDYSMTRRPVLTSMVAGVVLCAIVVCVGGFLAAIAWPSWYADFARSNARAANLISDTVLVVLPIGLLAFLFGLGLFRWLIPAQAGLVVACIGGCFIPGFLL